MARLHVNTDECVGSAHCTLTAPDLFAIDDEEGYVVLLQPEPPEDRLEAARAAVRGCPASVISLEE